MLLSCHPHHQEVDLLGDRVFFFSCVPLPAPPLLDGAVILRPVDVSSLRGLLPVRPPLLRVCASWTPVLLSPPRSVLVRRRRLLLGPLRARRGGGTFERVIVRTSTVLVVLEIWTGLVSVWIWRFAPTLTI